METGSFRGGATLTDGAYLYTALVHLHRSTGASIRGRTSSEFRGVRLNKNIPKVMGINAGYVSRTYFAGTVSPQDVLRRHTLFSIYLRTPSTKKLVTNLQILAEACYPGFLRSTRLALANSLSPTMKCLVGQ